MSYENMKKAVRTTVPKFIKVVPPVPATVEIRATAPQKRGALKALDAIEELFGKGGKHWTTGKYHDIQDGFESFCLSGAFNKVDGQHEALARAAVSVAIAQLYPDNVEADDAASVGDEDTIVTFNDSWAYRWADVKKVLKRARKLLS